MPRPSRTRVCVEVTDTVGFYDKWGRVETEDITRYVLSAHKAKVELERLERENTALRERLEGLERGN